MSFTSEQLLVKTFTVWHAETGNLVDQTVAKHVYMSASDLLISYFCPTAFRWVQSPTPISFQSLVVAIWVSLYTVTSFRELEFGESCGRANKVEEFLTLPEPGHWTGWSQELLSSLNDSVILGDFTSKGSSSTTVIIMLKNHRIKTQRIHVHALSLFHICSSLL